jgi:hypothetical protein
VLVCSRELVANRRKFEPRSNETWYVQAKAANGSSVWIVSGSGQSDEIPVITYAKARFNTTNPLRPFLGVVAAEMVLAKFVSSVTGFLANVSPNGQVL